MRPAGGWLSLIVGREGHGRCCVISAVRCGRSWLLSSGRHFDVESRCCACVMLPWACRVTPLSGQKSGHLSLSPFREPCMCGAWGLCLRVPHSPDAPLTCLFCVCMGMKKTRSPGNTLYRDGVFGFGTGLAPIAHAACDEPQAAAPGAWHFQSGRPRGLYS